MHIDRATFRGNEAIGVSSGSLAVGSLGFLLMGHCTFDDVVGLSNLNTHNGTAAARAPNRYTTSFPESPILSFVQLPNNITFLLEDDPHFVGLAQVR